MNQNELTAIFAATLISSKKKNESFNI